SLTIFTGAIAAMGIIAAVWSVWQRTRRQKRSLQQLGEEAQEAIDQLCAGADLKDVVLRCYVDMSHTLQESKGIERDKAMTPREFEQHLMNTGLPHEHVQQLTRLFEAVRYGAKHLGETEQQQAIRCLSAIVETCGSPT
ncbi:MAG: DUF4129 domain-containing protein, partial [Anaerolineae bacterium]|nr:DUF4129 domain-containing protein [Anaerolineae bacterium]